MIDVHTYIGGYPFRHVPHPDAETLLRVLDREGVESAWTAHLPSAFHRNPGPGNAVLIKALTPLRARLRATPCVRPDWPAWLDEMASARDAGAPAVKAYPQIVGMSPDSGAMAELAASCAEHDMALVLTVRFEDPRQRHPLDTGGDLPAAMVRTLARLGTGARLIVLGAGRAFVEEVHWSLTEKERAHVLWDISWIWGPPEDDLAVLLRTVGADRFLYGSGWPLRLAQTPRANLALLPDDVAGVSLGAP